MGSRSIAFATSDSGMREWADRELGARLGMQIRFVDLSAIWSQREERLDIGLFVDCRELSLVDFATWVRDWKRVDQDWPVAMLIADSHREIAQSALLSGAISYREWTAFDDELMRAWAVAQVRNMANTYEFDEHIEWSGLALDATSGRLQLDQQVVHLSVAESILMARLMVAAGGLVSREELARHLMAHRLRDSGMAAHIYRLRRNLEAFADNKVKIHSRAIGGYWLVVD
jgi:DNA-binding response OmpR family regulator